MTKREEIRKGIEDYTDRPAALWLYLHSQGVVIRGQSLGFSHPHLVNYFTVEPLIEDAT